MLFVIQTIWVIVKVNFLFWCLEINITDQETKYNTYLLKKQVIGEPNYSVVMLQHLPEVPTVA